MAEYLVESALLTHGLAGIQDRMLCDAWPEECKRIIWMERGEVIIGDIERFCRFRSGGHPVKRINNRNLDACRKSRVYGALTASGTIKICEAMGIRLAVTCGMGGLRTGQKKEECHDIMALIESPVSLIATSPKDMFDIRYTVSTIINAGIAVYGRQFAVCNGYLFQTEDVVLDGCQADKIPGHTTLLLNGIPKSERIKDTKILKKAVSYGKDQELKGEYFHPAVNKMIDHLTDGRSSWLQLTSMIENVKWAEKM